LELVNLFVAAPKFPVDILFSSFSVSVAKQCSLVSKATLCIVDEDKALFGIDDNIFHFPKLMIELSPDLWK
jgi:hypothetical protein